MSAPSAAPSARCFVGRGDELARLHAALADVRTGRGRCVLIAGDAGIGKTCLVEAVLAELPPSRVLWGRCHETGGAPAYWPWTQVLRSHLRRHGAEVVRRQAGAGAADVARLVPGIGAPAAQADDDSEAARFRLFDAFTCLLQAAGRDEPLAVALDDLLRARSHPSDRLGDLTPMNIVRHD